ncbi:dual specificity protein phosphatase CDC14C-like [Hylaeus anthracinus]|uniref:dual specificity protein phosphatase CDC14C-like n=1 Tax=Hylaeus anthracinus TaxID=313031 RepID=UPI0023B8D0EE|nr:dual specificity protein phosphatase CDC14C-like [Hylaeus anthracinus]
MSNLRSKNKYRCTMCETKTTRLLRSCRNIYDHRLCDVEAIATVYKHPDVTNICEYIKDKFYFATLANDRKNPRSNSTIHFFTIDDELIYNNFYSDFGPLNIACLYKYCSKVNKKLQSPAHKDRQIVHYTSQRDHKRANSAYLVASYAVLYLNKSPREAYNALFMGGDVPIKPFQDASMGTSIYTIHILDCLNALQKAGSYGFFNFNDFDLVEYEKYEDMRNGDLNWMVPQKFLGFVGPSTEPGTPYNPPECYIDYFLKNGVTAVVRLNKKTYDASRFTKAGITHYEMFMPDGTVPPRRVLNQFLSLSENTTGPIAVHCKAGLGRTGSLIAAYLIKHYKMTAREAIAWIRICRPGSVIGHQQTWLENIEKNLLHAGRQYKLKYYGDDNVILHHKLGIYSVADKLERRMRGSSDNGCTESNKDENRPLEKTNKTKFTRILGKLRNIRATENSERESQKYKDNDPRAMTQGDRLNEIKMNRYKLSRSIEPQQSYIARGLDSLRSPRKRK